MVSPIIQAQYEDLEQIAERFIQQADLVSQMRQRIQQATDALHGGGWEGQAAAAFQAEMEGDIFPAIGRLNNAFAEGGRSTRQIIEIIKAAEEEASNPFGGNGHPVPIPGVTPTPPPGLGGESDPTLYERIRGFFDFADKANNFLSNMPHIAKLLDNIEKLDGLTEFLKQRAAMFPGVGDMIKKYAGPVSFIIEVGDAGFDIYEDLQAGQGTAEVLISEGVEFGLETGIRALAITNPFTLGGMVVWDGLVLGGEFVGVDVPSLGDVADAAGNLVYDAGEAVVDFGGGLIESAGESIAEWISW